MKNLTAERLERLSSKIMDEWEKRTLDEVKAANLQETLALRNSLPIYLSQLADALSKTIDRTHARKAADKLDSTRIGKRHGRERAVAFEYTMDQMILEYHILRQTICDVMETEAPLTPVEREVIVCSIEQAVNDAATQFSDTLRDYQDQMAHTLAHDLRNPLSTLRASAQLMTKKTDDAKWSQERLARIIHSADRIDRMIQGLLDVSRIKAVDEYMTQFKECDLDWLLNDIASEMNVCNDDRFIVKSSGKCVGFWNEDSLRRVIENLATNAIKYGEANTSVIFSANQEGQEAILKVHNSGKAIPAEEQSTLFQKYKRASSAENKIGWGLGLAVVKEMVDIHKGTIGVESDSDKGTEFVIRLPMDSR